MSLYVIRSQPQKKRLLRRIAITAVVLLSACASPQKSSARTAHTGNVQYGNATWYGKEAQGGPTASGERFDRHQYTAAHRTLPLGTIVKVTNQRNGRSIEVRINDRGPYAKGRVIDLSEAAARVLGMIDAGVVPVEIEVVTRPGPRPPRNDF
ncbi:MAG TPA: septal ring lytic transglycosylase RlpA family protein [Kofleriaceae bacterium]|jgi:rare lipoprotein A